MTLQSLCHAFAGMSWLCLVAAAAHGDPAVHEDPTHDYPTHARVEFVQECMAKNGGKLSTLYQCSCVIDRIATSFSYDDFVEAATFARYSSLPGEGGAIFRDSEHAREMAKRYRSVESEAYAECGLGK
jgi:hypothetical protein